MVEAVDRAQVVKSTTSRIGGCRKIFVALEDLLQTDDGRSMPRSVAAWRAGVATGFNELTRSPTARIRGRWSSWRRSGRGKSHPRAGLHAVMPTGTWMASVIFSLRRASPRAVAHCCRRS